MRVLLVTTWGTACGIAEHSSLLKEAVELADSEIQIVPDAEALNPQHPSLRFDPPTQVPDVVHLNYHAALHSRWTPGYIQSLRRQCKVLVTYHDTGVPNSNQCKSVCEAADYFVVHEPYEDLPAHGEYLRMGVADWVPDYQFDTGRRPLLGTVGFPFPWKNYDELAKVTKQCGWDLLLLAPNATPEDEARWKAINPRTTVCPTFLDQRQVVSWLGGCDATAFMYTCANTGQSGAILQGIAARKPVIALETCRQFRSLYLDWLGRDTIRWVKDFASLACVLRKLPIQRVDPGMVALAEQESWAKVGKRYAEIYRRLGGVA